MEWDDFVLLVINIVASAIPLSISIWADAFYQDQPEISVGPQVSMNIVYIKSSLCKMNEIFCLPPVRFQYVHLAWPFLQFSVHMNSVHTQMITPRINMPNTMIMPIEIEVNKRLSPIKYP